MARPRTEPFVLPCCRIGTDSMNRSWRNLLGATAWLLVTGLLSGGVTAEDDYRITNEVVLSDVRVSPMKVRDRAQITFLLEDRSAEQISFGGIIVTDARHSRIVASIGNGATATLDSISVAPGDILSADGEALWIEVDGLVRDLLPVGTIEATVRFGPAIIPISLTVGRESEPSN